LNRQYGLSLSLSTIQKVLNENNVLPLRRPKRGKRIRRYSRKIPGERVQIDTCKIALGLYQYTAVDDCTRYLVAEVYSARTASNTILFLEKVIEEMPFPVQRVQTDRGKEFFAYKVQEWLMEYSIRFRPIRPRQPHLNGKVERAQQTILNEFYAIVDLSSKNLSDQLAEYQHYFNWDRLHGSLGKTPMDRFHELIHQTPFWDEVIEKYEDAEKRYQVQNYAQDMELSRLKLKQSL
jgi:transposase InsO family protein